MKEYAYAIESFYDLVVNGDAELLIETLGRKKNFLIKGNQVDEDKTARLILKDWQEGKIRK
jgi:ribosome biogenesis GTPase A